MRPLLAAVIATSAALAAPSASGALLGRNETHPAVQVCQAALPAFETAVRKRPKAVQNEGTSTVFLSCGFEGRGEPSTLLPYARSLSIYFVNVGSELQTVSCTALEGQGEGGIVTKSRTVPGNDTQQSLQFTAEELDPVNGYWRMPVLSCAMPAGTGIAHIWYGFVEDDGH